MICVRVGVSPIPPICGRSPLLLVTNFYSYLRNIQIQLADKQKFNSVTDYYFSFCSLSLSLVAFFVAFQSGMWFIT